MEDQGKRLLLAVVIAFAIMMAWNYFFPTEPSPPERAPDTVTTPEGPAKPELPKPSARTDGGAPATVAEIGAPSVGERGQERLETFELDTFRAVFTSYGAALKSWELKGEKYRVEDGGQPRQLDLVRTQSEGLLPFRIGFEGLELVPEQSEWQVERKSDTEVAFTLAYEVEQNGARKKLFELVKTYRLYPRDYLVELTVSVQNLDADAQNVAMVLSLFGYQDPAAKSGGGWMGNVDTSWKTACLAGDELDVAGLDDLGETPRQRTGHVRWAGLMQSYFLMAASPALDDKAQATTCRLSLVPEQPGVMRADIVFPQARVNADDPAATSWSVTAYLGPKYLDALEGISATIGRDPGFGAAIDLGWFGFLVRPLLWLLQLFYSLAGNWGVAIVLLTVVVKLVTLPWTTKSMRSMKQMAKLRPKIEALQKKHADNRERQQVEMMNLYKAHGVNPLAGCLPMLLQMPIWFALYRMLMTAGELYRAPLIPGWIHDLTASDPFYILPIILVGMMFLQAKLSPTTADSAQQKIMMYGLPLTFGFFSFFLPSGLTLYILTNTVLTTLHQLWMNRTDPPVQPAKSDAADTAKKAADAGTSRTGGARERRTIAETPRAKSAGPAPAGDEGETTEPASQDRGPRRSGSRKRGGKSRRR